MSKITAYAALTAALGDDVLPVVDVHDTTMAPSGTTKKITAGNLLAKTQYAPVAAPLPSGDTTGATDTPALNAALAALTGGEALILTVPGYWISAPLSVPNGCALIGSGQPGTGTTADISAASGFSGAAMVANAGFLNNTRTGDDGIEIANLYLDGQNGGSGGPFVSTHGHGIVLSAAHSRIHHCYVKNASGAGIVWADMTSSGLSVNSGTTQENYCYDNKVSNPGQWCIWVPNTSGSVGMTDSVISRCIVTDPGYGSFYRNGNGNPQINPSNNFPYEAIRLDNGAGWWVTENHAYWCPGGAYFFGTLYSTHVLNNTCDSWGTFPWSLPSGVFTAGVINGMSLHKVKCDINVPPAITGRAIPSVVSGNVLNTLEGLNGNGIYAAGSGGSGNGTRFTFFDVTVDTLTVPAGATGQAALVFTGNVAHQNSVGGQSVTSCTTANGSATVTAAGGAFAGVQKGMSVTGTGIPASTYVGSVVTGGSDSLTLVQSDQATAQNATASGTVTLTFPGPYSLAEKWTGTVASTVLNATHSGNRATGSVVAQPTVSTSNGAVINLLGEIGGVTLSGVPASGGLSVAGALTTPPVTLTDAASIAVNAALSNAFRVTLGGNRTLANPTNPTDDQAIVVEVIQDGTGSRTLAYGSAYSFPGPIGTPVLSTTAGFHDFLVFRYNAGDTTWRCVGFVPQQAAAAAVATVPQGGTGQSSLTAWALLAGGTTSTGALQQVGVGTSTQVLTSNGPGALPSFQAASSGFANPMTTLGDIIYENATPAAARLAGDTSNTRKFLRTQAASGTAQAPAWDTLQAGDLPTGTTSTQGALQLDGTATDITVAGTAVAAGAIGKAADAGHVHAVPLPLPADFSQLAWTNDPGGASASSLLVSGTIYLASFVLRSVATIGHIGVHVITAGSTLTSGQSLLGIYSISGSTGTLQAQTADQSGVWTSTGAQNTALTSSITNAPVGRYLVAFLSVGTTPPTFRSGGSSGLLGNTGLSGAALRYAINGTSQTSLPSTLTLSSSVSAGTFPLTAVIGS